MTRNEVEKELMERLKEIRVLLDKFYSDKEISSDYLTLAITGTHLAANNDYFYMDGSDYSSAIDCWQDVDEDGNWTDICSMEHPNCADLERSETK